MEKPDVMTNDNKVKDCNFPPLSAGLLVLNLIEVLTASIILIGSSLR